jgi:hypothetical protein
MLTRRTHPVWGVITCILVVTGIPLLAWSGYSSATTAYALWTHGIEKRASVIRLERVYAGRGGTAFDYIIEIDGRQVQHEFRVRLPVGESVPVLVLPEDSRTIEVGDKSSTLFAIFASMIGGRSMATGVLIMFAFMSVAVPRLLWMLLRGRKILRSGWM